MSSQQVKQILCPLCQARARQEEIYKLRQQGKTLDAIGLRLRTSKQSIYRSLQRYTRYIKEEKDGDSSRDRFKPYA